MRAGPKAAVSLAPLAGPRQPAPRAPRTARAVNTNARGRLRRELRRWDSDRRGRRLSTDLRSARTYRHICARGARRTERRFCAPFECWLTRRSVRRRASIASSEWVLLGFVADPCRPYCPVNRSSAAGRHGRHRNSLALVGGSLDVDGEGANTVLIVRNAGRDSDDRHPTHTARTAAAARDFDQK
jgi:hypothetical protein